MATLAVALPAAAIPEPGGLGARLIAPATEEAAFVLSAEGDQVFECKPADNGYAWSFTAPDVTFYEDGRSVATQTTPNLWESSSDRSGVVGWIRSTQGAGDNALPWALLGARPTSDSGMFAGVTSIQRVNTAGGAAPLTGCDAGAVGSELRVPFTAEYYFYKRRGVA